MRKQLPPAELAGNRITLRKIRVDDAAQICAHVTHDRCRLAQFLPWVDEVHTVDDEVNWIKLMHRRWASYTEFPYGICAAGSSRPLLGSIGVHNISWEHCRAEIGYWIAADQEGKGYVHDALALLERELFQLGFHRLQICCRPENLRSIRVAERAGYLREGVLRHNIHERGQFRDTVIFSKLSPRA